MLYKEAFSFGLISLSIHLVTVTSKMQSYAPMVVGSMFNELPTLSSESQDVYGCLLNNGLCVIQPEMGMDLDVIKVAMGLYYQFVRAVFIQSPQAAYVDICLGDGLTSPSFHSHFTGIHPVSLSDGLQKDCNVVFHPLAEKATPDQMVTLAIAIAEGRELPGMSLFYLHSNPEWRPSNRPRLFDLPSGDDLDELEKQL